MLWHAECLDCGRKIKEHPLRDDVLKEARRHRLTTNHRVLTVAVQDPGEVKRCEQSGRTYLAAVGELV